VKSNWSKILLTYVREQHTKKCSERENYLSAVGAEAERQAGKTGRTAHAPPSIFSISKTSTVTEFMNIFPNRVNVFERGTMLPVLYEVSPAVAKSSRLCKVLGSSAGNLGPVAPRVLKCNEEREREREGGREE
jgi:hypothetical protein